MYPSHQQYLRRDWRRRRVFRGFLVARASYETSTSPYENSNILWRAERAPTFEAAIHEDLWRVPLAPTHMLR